MTDLNSQLIAFKQRHSNERNGFGLIHGNTPQRPIPIHCRFIDIKNTLAAVRQKRARVGATSNRVGR